MDSAKLDSIILTILFSGYNIYATQKSLLVRVHCDHWHRGCCAQGWAEQRLISLDQMKVLPRIMIKQLTRHANIDTQGWPRLAQSVSGGWYQKLLTAVCSTVVCSALDSLDWEHCVTGRWRAGPGLGGARGQLHCHGRAGSSASHNTRYQAISNRSSQQPGQGSLISPW